MSMLPTVRRQLFEAVERRAQPRPRVMLRGRLVVLRRPLLTTAHVAIGALCAVPVLIVAVALLLLGAHRAPPSPAAQPQSETARQQLIDNFGLLRRAQTGADRDSQLLMPPFDLTERRGGRTDPGLEQQLRQSGYPRLDQALMRVVRVTRFDAKVALEPMTWRPSPASGHRSEGIELVMWIGSASTIPPSSEDGTGPAAVPSVLAHGLALTDARPNNSVIDGVVAVPDNVAKVTVRPIRLLRSPVRVDPSSFGIATAPVHENLAAYQLRLPTVHGPRSWVSSLFGTDGLAEVTWFDAAGKVIKRTTTTLGLFVRLLGTQTASAGASKR